MLGRGGTADVWDARDELLRRPVAVKLLRDDLHSRPDVRDRLKREARAAAQLNHPAIVRLFDAGEIGGVPFLVMERLPGETLADRYLQGTVTDEWLSRAAVEVADALAYAHREGRVHRDVKPGNIMITEAGDVRLGDFGIATSPDVSGDPSTSGLIVGTPAYLAPERIQGGPGTPASDIYGLGVVLYEGFAGRRPFPGRNPVAVARAALTQPPTPLPEVRPDLPPALTSAVDRALSRDPARRHASAEEFATRLREGAAALAALTPHALVSADAADATVAVPITDTQLLPAVPSAVASALAPSSASDDRRSPPTWAVVGAVAVAMLLVLTAAGAIALGGSGTEPVSPAGADPATAVEQSPDPAPATHGDPDEDGEKGDDDRKDDDKGDDDGKDKDGDGKGRD